MSGGTVILVRAGDDESLRRRSAAAPHTLFVDVSEPMRLARGGTVVTTPRPTGRLVLALACRPGVCITSTDLIELLWGEDPTGGPDGAKAVLAQHLMTARDAGVALGIAIINRHSVGFCARLLELVFAEPLQGEQTEPSAFDMAMRHHPKRTVTDRRWNGGARHD